MFLVQGIPCRQGRGSGEHFVLLPTLIPFSFATTRPLNSNKALTAHCSILWWNISVHLQLILTLYTSELLFLTVSAEFACNKKIFSNNFTSSDLFLLHKMKYKRFNLLLSVSSLGSHKEMCYKISESLQKTKQGNGNHEEFMISVCEWGYLTGLS